MYRYSFIIPHKNSISLLQRCLNSIPSRNDIQIVVVDDNSDEKNLPKIERSNLTIIYDKTSLGAGHARNVGLKHARGEWVFFADCDDYYKVGFLDVLEAYSKSDHDIIYFDCYFRINPLTGETKPNVYSSYFTKYCHNEREIDKANLKHCINAPWNKMYRRAFVLRNYLKFEEIPIGNDAFFVNKASSITDNVAFIDNKLYYYVDNPSGITRKKLRPINEIKILFDSAARVDVIKANSHAWQTIQPIVMSFFRQRVKDYGFINTVKLYWNKITYPHYPLFRTYIHKLMYHIKL